MTSRTAGRAVLSFAQQVGLSVLGTLAATAVLAELRSEWAMRPAAPLAVADAGPSLPSLTRGGKFAARALDGTDPEPFVTLTALPAVLPLFTALAVPPLDTSPSALPADFADAAPLDEPPAAAAKPLRPAGRHEIRRLATLPPVPPRRDQDGVVAMAALPDLSSPLGEAPSLWVRSKTVYRTVASWSGSVVDTLMP